MNYPLTKLNKEGTLLKPTNSLYSDECADTHCDLHLRSEIHEDDQGKTHTYFRLRAYEPHTIEMALKYSIRCPKCSVGMLKQVGRCLSSHELGLYSCPICDKNNAR
jgi:hypothetical protein